MIQIFYYRKEKIIRPILRKKTFFFNAAPVLFLGDQKLADLTITIRVSIYNMGFTFALLLLSFPWGRGREGRGLGHVAIHRFPFFLKSTFLGMLGEPRQALIAFTCLVTSHGILSSRSHTSIQMQGGERIPGFHSRLPSTQQRAGWRWTGLLVSPCRLVCLFVCFLNQDFQYFGLFIWEWREAEGS